MKNVIVPAIFTFFGSLPLGVIRALGAWVGNVVWLLKTRSYCHTYNNLARCMPELSHRELHALARKSLIETACTVFEAGFIWRRSWAQLATKMVAVQGEDILRTELAQGKGLLVLAPHLGNWEMVAPYLASFAPLTAMYQPVELRGLNDMILAGRTKNNIQMAPTNRKGVSMLLKALQQGTIVGILPDQVPETGSGMEPALFFGKPAQTMTLVHALASRTGCRVVCVFAERVPGGFKLITLPADPLIYSNDVVESVRGLNASIEACIRIAPAQYQWEYNRFKSLPDHLKSTDLLCTKTGKCLVRHTH